MAHSVISADPNALGEYSHQTTLTDEQLRAEASYLACKLELFGQRCFEYRMGIDAQLAQPLQSHAQRAYKTDQRVGEIGRSFKRAGEEGSLNWWIWGAAREREAGAGAQGAAAAAGAQWLATQSGQATLAARASLSNAGGEVAPMRIRPAVARAVSGHAAIPVALAVHAQTAASPLFSQFWRSVAARAEQAGRWLAQAKSSIIQSAWARLRSLGGAVQQAMGRLFHWPAGAAPAQGGFQPTAQGQAQWVCRAPSAPASQSQPGSSQSGSLIKRSFGAIGNGMARIGNFLKNGAKNALELVKNLAARLGAAFLATLRLMGSTLNAMLTVAKRLTIAFARVVAKALVFILQQVVRFAIWADRVLWEIRKYVFWHAMAAFVIVFTYVAEFSVFVWNLLPEFAQKWVMARLMMFVLLNPWLCLSLIIGVAVVIAVPLLAIAAGDMQRNPDARRPGDDDFLFGLGGLERRLVAMPEGYLSEPLRTLVFRRLDSVIGTFQRQMGKGTTLRSPDDGVEELLKNPAGDPPASTWRMDQIFGDTKGKSAPTADGRWRLSPSVLMASEHSFISDRQFVKGGRLYSEQLSLFKINKDEYVFSINGLNPATLGTGTKANLEAVNRTAEGDPADNEYYLEIKRHFVDSIKDGKVPPGSAINFTGHSMGAGVIMLLLNDPEVLALLQERRIKVNTVTTLEMVRPAYAPTIDTRNPPGGPLSETKIVHYVDTDDAFAMERGAGHGNNPRYKVDTENIRFVDEPEGGFFSLEDTAKASHTTVDKDYRDSNGQTYYLDFEINPSELQLIDRYGQDHGPYGTQEQRAVPEAPTPRPAPTPTPLAPQPYFALPGGAYA